ncbi:VanZ family protein [Lysobacter sp. H21R4]|uniref:VanZ family protein n=1 Tax=Lysobacter sp. H21R4 TaxID=2781021 RepID=UPI0018879B6D|nr:VanZ family protein [Lysobacter sp. H21R4]QOY62005.1 VanZ family protein [Lysobacter sp. H21R4]
MTLTDGVLLALAVGVSLWLGRGSGRRPGRALLVMSALAISALLFLPTAWLQTAAGPGGMASLEAIAARVSWDLSDAVHFLIFVWLALLLRLLRRDLRGWLGIAVLLVLAVAAELSQGLTSAREVRLDDVCINVFAAGTGLLLAEVTFAARKLLERTRR